MKQLCCRVSQRCWFI